jgi:hypothetical protein
MSRTDKQQFTTYLNDDNKWIVVDYYTGIKFKGDTCNEAVEAWINWLQIGGTS